MAFTAVANQVPPTPLVLAAALVTRPEQPPALQWIVDPTRHDELTTFHHDILGGAGTLTQHPPTKGASRGFSELRVDTSDVPPELVAQLPQRLRAAITPEA